MNDDDEVESARQEHEDLCWLDHAERLVGRTLDELAEGEATRWEEWLFDHAGFNQESQEGERWDGRKQSKERKRRAVGLGGYSCA